MNKIVELLLNLNKEAKDYGSFGVPLDNPNYKSCVERIMYEFCSELVADARYLTFDDSVSEFLEIYLNPEPKPTKVKVTISTLKQFNWNNVCQLPLI